MNNLLIFLFFLMSCTRNQISKNTYTLKEKPRPLHSNELIVAIFNEADKNHSGKSNLPLNYKKNISNKYVNILKSNYDRKLVLISAGGVEDSGFIVKNNFDTVLVDPLDISNLMDNNLNLPKEKLLASNYRFINHSKTLRKMIPYKIIQKGPYKIALISLRQLTLNIASEYKLLNGLYNEDPVVSILRLKKILDIKKVNTRILFITSNEKTKSIRSIVARIPKGYIDLIITLSDDTKKYHNKHLPLKNTSGSLDLITIGVNNNQITVKENNKILLCEFYWEKSQDCNPTFNIAKQKKIDSKYLPALFFGKKI